MVLKMDSMLSQQIKCSVCLNDFTDPVMLPCEHSFCRVCITEHIQASNGDSQCPECRRHFTASDLHSSRLLRNMTDIVRQHLEASSIQAPQNFDGLLVCVKHDEKLKLFCETDQKLLCVVCREGTKHRGHQIKPVEEAALTIKRTIRDAVSFLTQENRQLNDLTQKQETELSQTQRIYFHIAVKRILKKEMNLEHSFSSGMMSRALADKISLQFGEMHRFLEKKEEEIKKQLETQEQSDIKDMHQNISTVNKRLLEGKALECIFQSSMEIDHPDLFLQWWKTDGFHITERMKIKNSLNPDIKYRSQVNDLNVIPHSLFLGPYETHLQFFVWKAMLRTVKPVPEILSLMDPGDSYLKLSPGKLSVRQADRQSNYYKDYNPGVISEQNFQFGQHYWELEVGNKLDWSIGVKRDDGKKSKESKSKDSNDIYLNLIHGTGYVLSSNGKERLLRLSRKPSKIGLYLDCGRKRVTFYNADVMTQIIETSISDLPCFISLFPGVYLKGKNIDPVTVCSYWSNSA